MLDDQLNLVKGCPTLVVFQHLELHNTISKACVTPNGITCKVARVDYLILIQCCSSTAKPQHEMRVGLNSRTSSGYSLRISRISNLKKIS